MFFVSSFPPPFCTVRKYIYSNIRHDLSSSSPSLWLSGNSASPQLTVFSWGWSTVCSYQEVHQHWPLLSPAVGAAPGVSMAGRQQWTGKVGKAVLRVVLAAQEDACNVLHEKTLLTAWSFALNESCTLHPRLQQQMFEINSLTSFIWLLFVHHHLQLLLLLLWYSKPLSVANSCKLSFILFWIWFSFSVDHTNNSITHWIIEQ